MSPYREAELVPAAPRWGATWKARAWARALRFLGARMPLSRRMARDWTRYRLAMARYPAELAAWEEIVALVPLEWKLVTGRPRLVPRVAPLPPSPPPRYVDA